MSTTNYYNTFIQIAEDCSAEAAEIPPLKGEKKSIANMQFEMVYEHPYQFTSDDVLFKVFTIKNEIPESEWSEAREQFFSKGQPCFRASPLTKRYGWGVHNNEDGKMAIFGIESEEYCTFINNQDLAQTKAMRSKRIK